MGVTRTDGMRRACPATTTSRCSRPAPTSSATRSVHTGHMAINSATARRPQLLPADRLLLPGLQVGREMVDALHRDPQGRGHRQARGPAADAMALKIEHDAAGKVTGVVYVDKDGKQQRQKAPHRRRGRQLDREPAPAAELGIAKFPDGLANSSGQVGRNYMRHMTGSVYGVFEKPVHMYRGTTMAGIIRDEARHDPSRGFVGGYEMETLSLGLPFMAAFLDPGAWGREFTRALDSYDQHGRACGSSARTCRRRPTASPCSTDEGQVRHAGRRTCTSTTTRTTSPCATTPTSRARRSTRRSARRAPSRRRPIPRRTTSAPTG